MGASETHGAGHRQPAPIDDTTKANFETLKRAAANEDLCLIAATRKADGADCVLLAAAEGHVDGDFLVTPFAEMISGDPYALYDPPQ